MGIRGLLLSAKALSSELWSWVSGSLRRSMSGYRLSIKKKKILLNDRCEKGLSPETRLGIRPGKLEACNRRTSLVPREEFQKCLRGQRASSVWGAGAGTGAGLE